MALTKEEIRTAALELNPKEREALAEELLLSIADHESAQIDAAWLEEIRKREAEFEAGRMTAIPAHQAIEAIAQKIRR